MQKIQVLLPEPVLRDLREIAAVEDRPLSEVVRRAAEQIVRMYPKVRRKPGGVAVRTVDGGGCGRRPPICARSLMGRIADEERRYQSAALCDEPGLR